MRIGILEPESFSQVARHRLSALGTVEDYSGRDLALFLADKEALFVRLAYWINSEFLRQAPRLTFLCSPTTGHTHIDVDALARRQIKLLSLQGATAFMEQIRATPEHLLGLTIALMRNYRKAFLSRDNNHWDRDRCKGEEISGTRFGLIGFGRVGCRFASYLSALGAEISCHDPYIDVVPRYVRRCHSLDELLDCSRVVAMLASSMQGAQPILDAAAIQSLAGKYFINIARGELVDEQALLTAIEQGELAGCAVDVISNETGANNRDRWIAATSSANVIVTPHIGGATFKSMQMTEEFIAHNLVEAVAAAESSRNLS